MIRTYISAFLGRAPSRLNTGPSVPAFCCRMVYGSSKAYVMDVSPSSRDKSHPKLDSKLVPLEDPQSVVRCAQALKSGKLIAVPTDTVYGIAGLAQITPALARIYKIKERDLQKPIAICVGNHKDIYRWANATVIPGALLRELLPGPVTAIFERRPELNPALNPGTNLIGVRIPEHTFMSDLVETCGEPLALTSANKSGGLSSLSTEEFSELWPHLEVVVDDRNLGLSMQNRSAEDRAGSTVVDLSVGGKYRIVRSGSALKQTVEKLERFGLIVRIN